MSAAKNNQAWSRHVARSLRDLAVRLQAQSVEALETAKEIEEDLRQADGEEGE
jgi:hypothetical protein